jgi:hypothetical protein
LEDTNEVIKMAVDFHRHCQKTVLPAKGTRDSEGATWNTIAGLNGVLTNLPNGWLGEFSNNTNNITEDFRGVLKVINNTSGELNTKINDLTSRIIVVEGLTGQNRITNVKCFIAPNEAYFRKLGYGDPSLESVSVQYNNQTITVKTKYYLVNNIHLYVGTDGNVASGGYSQLEI